MHRVTTRIYRDHRNQIRFLMKLQPVSMFTNFSKLCVSRNVFSAFTTSRAMSDERPLVAFHIAYGDTTNSIQTFMPDYWLDLVTKHIRLIEYTEACQDVDTASCVQGVITFGCKHEDYSVFPNLKIVSNFGAGYDGLDVKGLKERKVLVTNTPRSVRTSTADVAVGLLIAVSRRFGRGFLKPWDSAFMDTIDGTVDLYKKTVGIVGMGGIGFEIAKRLNGFDMNIAYHQRNRRPDDEIFKAKYFSVLDQMLAICDFVIIALPLTNETRLLFNYDRLKTMKSKAILINIARGAIVDTQALTKVLEEGHLVGAGLDVTDPDPLPKGHPLLSRADVFILPHIGCSTAECNSRIIQEMMENLMAGLNGQIPPNVL